MVKEMKNCKVLNYELFIFMISLILAISLVWGASTITTSSGATTITINDDTDTIVNITVNVTTPGTYSNVTAVMINLSELVTKANLTAGALALAQINTSIP